MKPSQPKSGNPFAAASRVFAAAFVLVFGMGSLTRADGASLLSEMDHAMWTARDGAPQGILELAQSRDGILWIGSEGGLYTFDGHAFNIFQSDPGQPDIPPGEVTSILVASDGAVWVGFYEGRIARIDHGRVNLYGKADNQKLCCAHDIREAADGSIWAVSSQSALVRFGPDGKWHVEPSPAGASGGRIFGLFIDSSNRLWVPQSGRLFERPLAQSAWRPTNAKVDWPFGFAEAPDHTVWINDFMLDVDRGRTQQVDRSGNVLNRLSDNVVGQALLYAPDGSIIVATDDYGLRRYVPASQGAAENAETDSYTHLDGLSSDSPRALLLDKDGNIWVGGQRGLDRFRKARLIPFVTKGPTGEWSICGNRQGNVWLADDTGRLDEVSSTGTRAYPNVGSTYSISCGNDGVTRLVDERGIWEVDTNGAHLLPAIPNAHPHAIAQVVATRHHTLFASVASGFGEGWLWQYAQNKWSRVSSAPPRTPSILYVDSRDRLWAGYRQGLIGLPLEGRSPSAGKPDLGTVYAMLQTSHGMFAVGMNGLAVLHNNHPVMLAFADRTASVGAAGLVESHNGDLWLNASHGIVHIRAADLLASLGNPRLPIKSSRVTEGDFVGPVRLLIGHSTTARDFRGDLWFATLNGVLHLDPVRLNSESHLPFLSIKSIEADGTPLRSGGTIGPQPQTLDIQYLGVNLTAPEDVIYRYRIDGLDTGWQDAGHRTEAIYTHLRPGNYTFRVIASNDNEKWTVPVSSAAITVLPSFYQTGWFVFLCSAAGLFLLWLTFTLRIRSVSHVIRARAEERAEERIRIARELHDTLLQGFQGLLLTFHATAQKVAPDGESRAILERTLSMADRVIIEGRNRVNSLRTEQLGDSDLIDALRTVGRDLGAGNNTECEVRRCGIIAPLTPNVAEEVLYIGREALTNAFRHSHASRISLELNYGARCLSMTCSDNGRGFEPARQVKPGHWGLKGMLERAESVGGNLVCRSAPSAGTVIVFTLVSWRAYRNHSRVAYYLRGALSLVLSQAQEGDKTKTPHPEPVEG